jgi:hypothetical protein
METVGLGWEDVVRRVRQSVGDHRLAVLLMNSAPNVLDKAAYELSYWANKMTTQSRLAFATFFMLSSIKKSLPSFFVLVDYIKDFITYRILANAIHSLDVVCKGLLQEGAFCLVSSEAELAFLTTLKVSLLVSILTTSLFCFLQRELFFPTRHCSAPVRFCSGLFLLVCSPLLPILFHFQIMLLEGNLARRKKTIATYQEERVKIDTLITSSMQGKAIEVSSETIPQIILILLFISFYQYSMISPAGLRYSYFWGIAKIVLKDHYVLFVGSFIISLFGPCFFYVSYLAHSKNGSLNLTSKLVLVHSNVLLLVARLGSVASTLVITVLASSEFAMDHVNDFNNHFSAALSKLSQEIGTNSIFLAALLFVHLLAITTHAILRSTKYPYSSLTERLLYLVSSFWLPLPFLTPRPVDRGEEGPEFRFLAALHTIENLAMLAISRAFYLHQGYPTAIWVLDLALIFSNILGVLLLVLYQRKLALYAGLGPDLPVSGGTWVGRPSDTEPQDGSRVQHEREQVEESAA